MLGICSVALLLAGCADDGWRNARKSPQDVKADHEKCNAQAEDATLLRSRRQRADYNPLPAPGTQPGYYRGETPVQLADRSENERSFGQQFAECMESKGYSRGVDKDKQP